MSNLGYRILEWDSSFFEQNIAMAIGSTFCADDRSIIESAEERGVKCLYFLTSSDCPATLEAMCFFGSKFIDGRLTLELDLCGAWFEADPMMAIRAADSNDLPAVERIASASHQDTRFFKDSRFPDARCRELYRQWIGKDLQEGRVLVARCQRSENEAVLGYLSYLVSPEAGEAQLSLIAVSSEARGRGIATSLISFAVHHFREIGCTNCKVVTQASNIGAQRLYQKFGFRTSGLDLWFHKWF